MSTSDNVAQAQLEELMNLAGLGETFKEIMEDEERPVTFMEISMRRSSAEHMFRKTGDIKYAKIAAKCEGALKAMTEKAQTEGKYLHMKPSELDKLLSVSL